MFKNCGPFSKGWSKVDFYEFLDGNEKYEVENVINE